MFLSDIQGESSSSFNSYQIPEEGKFSGSSKVRPKKILHFSDGIMEEYSSDEEGIHPVPQTAPLVDPVSFTIIIFYHTLFDLTPICYY